MSATGIIHYNRRDSHVRGDVFWFHPLVWWIGKRMVEERERACDQEVLRLGSEPRVYAEGILNICKLHPESALACVSGVTGADLKKRIESIMKNRALLRLDVTRKAVLTAAGVAALALPIAVGIVNAPFGTIERGPETAHLRRGVGETGLCAERSDA
jgi:beta-lactamase regulating signal transducer with metallopeptidase domain